MTTTNLRSWLTDLTHRSGRITTDGNTITLHGTPTHWHDHHTIRNHQHALLTAAAGTHPVWWSHVTGRGTWPPEPDQIPWADDGFACATCGHPAAHLDPTLLPFCDEHWTGDQENTTCAA